jgi:ATP-dependent DNA helicase RecG
MIFISWGAGTSLLGVAEDRGQAVLPPAGLPLAQIDAVQKEIVELGYRMVPY